MGVCKVVAKGGVGESGASSTVHHKFDEKITKNMVMRAVDSNLCSNTGASAVLIINGKPVACGDITGVGSTISAEVGPEDQVVGIVNTVPLFNNIKCVMLGELSFTLEECDFI